MGAGKYRHYVTIQEPSYTQNSFGEQTASWSTVCSVWASIDERVGTERSIAHTPEGRQKVTITTRYPVTIDRTMRVVDGSVVYSINGYAVINRGREVQIEATR